MANTIAGISALIKTKLESIVDGSSNRIIPEVLEYPTGAKTKYPSAEILPTGVITTKRIEMGNGRNERVINFRIKLYQENTDAGIAEGATARVAAAIDAILEDFDGDPDLGDEVASIIIESVQIDYAVRFPEASATMDVRCAIIVNV